MFTYGLHEQNPNCIEGFKCPYLTNLNEFKLSTL